jgi:hypothetical protein
LIFNHPLLITHRSIGTIFVFPETIAMRILLLSIIFTLMIPPPKVPKFKYLDKTVPLYISIKKLPKNTEDEVLNFIRDSLVKAGCKIIDFEENRERLKQFLKDAQANTKLLAKADFEKRDDVFRKMYAGATPVQELSIIYISGADSVGTYETFDQVGFRHTLLPQSSFPPSFPVRMFKAKEIGSRMPDSIARFLLKKM